MAAAACLIALVAAGPASGQTGYRVTPVGPRGGYVELHGVSDTGVVAGYAVAAGHSRAIAWADGSGRTLPELPGGRGAVAWAISPNGIRRRHRRRAPPLPCRDLA